MDRDPAEAGRSPTPRAPLLFHPVVIGFALMLLFALLRVLWAASAVILLGFLSVLVATLLTYPLDFLGRFMPRWLALVATVLALVGLLIGLVLLIVPVVDTQASRLVAAIPVALDRIAAFGARLRRSGQLAGLPPGESLSSRLMGELEALLAHAIPFALGVGSVLVTGFVLLVLALCLAYSPRSYLEGIRALVPREREPILDALWARLGATLRHWTAGILGSMTVMGVLAALGLFVAGIQGWLVLGIITFLATFIPYVGAIASAIPGLLIGLSQGPLHLLYAALVYTGVHLAEGYLVSPLIMRHTVSLRPATLLFWQLFMTSVFGLPGVIVATPLLACAEVAVELLYVEGRLKKRVPGL